MSAILLRIGIYLLIGGIIYFGLRRIWRDWAAKFQSDDQAQRQRDLKERARPDVVDLKRDEDGVYRPPDDDKK